ncbi:MAG: Fe-S cluster assembly protein SufB, partial [Lachnospiraceae bacterium]|nr:Fe-S cluster assembly protein SufB [Lachnospiraceae bacterium]
MGDTKITDDIERGIYDFRDEERESEFFRMQEGLTEDIVKQISKEKNDPSWMLDFRLKSLEIYNKTEMPD